jgi:hypothetical protein
MVHFKLSVAFVLAAAVIAPVVALPHHHQLHSTGHETVSNAIPPSTGSDNGLTSHDDLEIL